MQLILACMTLICNIDRGKGDAVDTGLYDVT